MKLIAMVDRNWGIGKNGKQPIHIPTDLKRFKELTKNSTVIMGRKTLEALPGGRPLPDRHNIVLSHNPDFKVDGAIVAHDIVELLDIAPKDAFVIGGETVYRELLPCCNTAYVTKVQGFFFADRFCPDLDELSGWRVRTESPFMEDNVVFRWVEYERT